MTKVIYLTAKYLSVFIAVLIILVPLYIVFLNAFKGTAEFSATSVFAWPKSFLNSENLQVVMDRGRFGKAFYNIGYILVITVIGNVLIGTMVAYCLGRIKFRFNSTIIMAYSIAALVHLVTTQVAIFSIIKDLGLFNTHYAPIILWLGTDIIQIYLYLQFIRNFPYELDENAMIEGASLFRIYATILLPLLSPAIVTIVILKSIGIYNDMYIPLLYMPSFDLNVASTVLIRFTSVNSAQWNVVCMAILILMLPSIILFLFLQKQIFAGIASGAVK